jgi:hypothetical protein
VFFARLGVAPLTADYLAAVAARLWGNLILLAATFVLAFMLPVPRHSYTSRR